MGQESQRAKNRSSKVHPLFAQLYLNDDAEETDQPRRPRRSVPAKRVLRRA
jgi:hypothetical protein